MRKGRVRILFLSLAVIFVFLFTGDVGAFDFFDEKLRIHGFIRNETGYRLKDHVWYDPLYGARNPAVGGPEVVENGRQDSGTLSTCRTTLQLESEFDVTRDFMLAVTVRGFYDAKWDLDGSLSTGYAYTGFDNNGNDLTQYNNLYVDSNDMRGMPDGENYEYDVDLREYYFKWAVGDFMIKVGRQQIAWGEADAIRIADTINPLDFSRDFTTTVYGLDWEDIRIPQRMAQIVYVVPESKYQFEFELVVSPEDFECNMKGMPYGETWYLFPQQTGFSNVPFYVIHNFAGFGIGSINSEIHAFTDAVVDAYDNAEDSFSGGARLRGVFGGWDLHLFYYHQRFQDPIISAPYSWEMGFIPVSPRPDWGLKMHFPRINTIGATANYFYDPLGLVFRGECGYVIDEPFTTMNVGLHATGLGAPLPPFVPWDSWFNEEYTTKDTFHYMIGFDRPTWIPFLNETSTFFISWQFYHKIILDYNDSPNKLQLDDDETFQLDTMMGRDSRADHKTLTSLKINTKYMDDTIRPDILCVWDINAASGFVIPKIHWEPTYDWHFEIGAIYIWADNWVSGPFGYVSHNDLIYGVIEYKF